MIAFFNERADVSVDGELQERPTFSGHERSALELNHVAVAVHSIKDALKLYRDALGRRGLT